MPQKLTKWERIDRRQKQAFTAAHAAGDFEAMVRAAAPITRHAIFEADVTDVLGLIEKLVDDRAHPDRMETEAWGTYCQHVNAAYALGIAIGQVLSPNVFSKAGTR